MDQKSLIHKCKKGDILAQKELYNTYKTILYNISLKYCNSVYDAEDNLHNSFIEIFTNISQFNEKGSFEGWIKRITINKAIDSYKKTFHLTPLTSDLCDDYLIDDSDLDNISLDNILTLIQELPNQYRLVFCLFELDDYSHKEIAELLSVSENTSKSNLHRAKIILKEKITSSVTAKTYKIGNGK